MLTNTWKTSTRSGSNGQCVEVRAGGNGVQVRDSKDRDGGAFEVEPAAWTALLDEIRSGTFDR